VYINDQAQSLVTPAEGARIPDNIGVLYHYSDYDDENQRWMERVASLSLETIQNYQHLMLWNIPAIHKEFPDSRQLEFQSSWQLNGLTCTMEECTVNQGYIFVMGDNRDNSADGRMWGAVPVDNIKGKAKFVWLSVDGSKQSISLGRFTLPGFRSERHMMGIR
jgi:signal peptidase I